MFFVKQPNHFYSLFPVCFFLFLLLSANLLYYKHSKHKYLSVIFNLRPVRALIFISAVFVGAMASSSMEGFESYLKVFSAFASVFFAWEFSVVINDICDQEIDKITNKTRPLPLGILSVKEYAWIAAVYAFFALSFAFIVNAPVFLIAIVWVILGIAYSVHPFRLRKNILGNILIGVALASSFTAGFLSLGDPADLFGRTNLTFFIVLLVFGAAITLTKDLKDIRGDTAQEVKNIYLVYGRKKGKKIVIVLLFVSLVFPAALIRDIVQLCVMVIFAGLTCFCYYRKEDERMVYVMAALEGAYLFILLYLL